MNSRNVTKHLILATTMIALLCANANSQAEEKPTSGRITAQVQERIVVFAAASLKDVLEDIGAQFEKVEGVKIDFSFGPSNQLAIQILEGAPAYIYVAADGDWARKLGDAGLVSDVKQRYGNRLVMVVPKGERATSGSKSIRKPNDLLNAMIKKIALAGENVPAGKYAEQALTKVGIYTQLMESGRIIRGTDVRTVLSYVERGEVDVGFVYATDARASKLVEQIHVFDASVHDPIVYPMVLLKRSETNADARKFYEFLEGPRARSAFEKAGFVALDDKKP